MSVSCNNQYGSLKQPIPSHAIQFKEDWDNREFVHLVADNVKHIADFLGQFEFSCKGKLAALNDSITLLERKVEYLEARLTRGETLG